MTKNKLFQFENWLLWLSLFLLPWQLRHIFVWGNINGEFFEYGSLSLYAVDVVIILLLGLWFWRRSGKTSGLEGRMRSKRVEIGPKFFVLPLLLWLVWVTVSGLWAQDVWTAVITSAHYWLFFGWFVYLINEVKDIKKILWPFIVGIGLQAAIGVAQYLTNSSIGLTFLGESILNPQESGIPVVSDSARQLRAHGMLPHANILGGLTAVAMPVLWYLYYQVDTLRRPYVLMLTILISVALALTFSRAAWLALIVVAIGGIVIVLKTKNKILFQAIGLSVLAFILALGPQANFVLNRLNTTEMLEQTSINERIESFDQWQQVVVHNSVRGVGAGNYTQYLHAQDGTHESWWYKPVHNAYLLIVGELGVIGAAIWLWLMAVVLWLGWKIWRDGQEMMLIFLIPISIWVLGLVDHWPISLQQGRLLMFLALALTILANKVSYKGYTSRKK